MKRFLPVLCAVFLLVTPAFAQNSNDDEYNVNKYENHEGDICLNIFAGTTIPMNFPDFSSLFVQYGHQLNVGGEGGLGFSYYITPVFSLGCELDFGFNVTIGSHIFNYVPFLVGITYQPQAGRFEFPMTLNIGLAWETFSNYNYFPGLAIKPTVGVNYKITQNWAIGGKLEYLFLPEFMTLHGGDEDILGQFFNVCFSAKYYL